ncbi:glycosyltransferase [Candidatus Berkelbacteria bacterium]|nr:glycosyltransferase [Candidatus Berkelbacteria bacterium]
MAKGAQPAVSVIIPTLNRAQVLIETLRDILGQDYPGKELIVVDQSEAPDRTVREFVQRHRSIRWIHLEEKGTPNAKNVGARASQGEILVFLDDDVRISSDQFLRAHVANYADPQVGGVGGRVLMDSDPPLETVREVGKFTHLGLSEVTNFHADFRTPIHHVYGCNQSYRRSVFESIGGFTTIFAGNAHLEEADLSFRVRRVGFTLMFDPQAVLHHLHAPSGGTRTKDVYELRYWLIHNGAIFYLRHYGWLLLPLFVLKQLIWALTSALKRRDLRMLRTMAGALVTGIGSYLCQPAARQFKGAL